MDREAWRAAIHGVAVGHNLATELNWTEHLAKLTYVYWNLDSINSHLDGFESLRKKEVIKEASGNSQMKIWEIIKILQPSSGKNKLE